MSWLDINGILPNTDNSGLFLIRGTVSIGKSTLMASIAAGHDTTHSKVLFHSFDAECPVSYGQVRASENNIFLFIARVCFEFGDIDIQSRMHVAFGSEESLSYENDIIAVVKDMLRYNKFSAQITADSPAIVIVDALDLSLRDSADMIGGDSIAKQFLSYFPLPLPPQIRIIISASNLAFCEYIYNESAKICVPPPICSVNFSNIEQIQNSFIPPPAPLLAGSPNLLTSLLLADDETQSVALLPLPREALAEIANKILGRYNKILSSTQLETLLNNAGSSNLTWLVLACEELRLFGAFETITTHITNLPISVTDLVSLQIKRLEYTALVYSAQKGILVERIRDILLLTLKSRNGLLEEEIRMLVNFNVSVTGNVQISTILPYADWAILYSWVKPFLGYRADHSGFGKERFIIKNRVIKEAIEQYYSVLSAVHINQSDVLLIMPLKQYSIRLMLFFKNVSNKERSLEEYPYQVFVNQDKKEVNELRLSGMLEAVDYTMRRRLVQIIRCSCPISPIINGIPKYELMCLNCSMKLTFNRNRLNKMSCCICGTNTFSLSHTIAGKVSVKLNHSESYGVKCRRHNIDAYNSSAAVIRIKCYVCKFPSDPNFTFPVILCRHCSFGQKLCAETFEF